MNIFNELFRMNVSMVCTTDGIKMRGERANEAAAKFKSQRKSLLDEVAMYPSVEGVEDSVIDQARAVASAWGWMDDDWAEYFSRVKDAGVQIAKIYEAEQFTHQEKYA